MGGEAAMSKVRTDLGYDPNQWMSEDGHLHVSVPAGVPNGPWKRGDDGRQTLIYKQGEYVIKGKRYGVSRRCYEVYRNGHLLPLSLTGRLSDAKARAIRNARGEDRVNVA